MWTNLLKNLPWRSLLLAVVLTGLYYLGYRAGFDNAQRDGQSALSKLQSTFDRYKYEQNELESESLRFWAKHYQDLVTAGNQAETSYLEQIAQLENQNKQLKGKINDVTRRWIDEKGKSHPIECVFTRGFVRQYNAALGYETASADTGTDTAATAAPPAGTASRQPAAVDAWLRDSGVFQQDVLANIIDNAKQCRAWRSQINGLLDEREGLQK